MYISTTATEGEGRGITATAIASKYHMHILQNTHSERRRLYIMHTQKPQTHMCKPEKKDTWNKRSCTTDF